MLMLLSIFWASFELHGKHCHLGTVKGLSPDKARNIIPISPRALTQCPVWPTKLLILLVVVVVLLLLLLLILLVVVGLLLLLLLLVPSLSVLFGQQNFSLKWCQLSLS